MTSEERAERREALTHVYNVMNEYGYKVIERRVNRKMKRHHWFCGDYLVAGWARKPILLYFIRV